jgi:hypothetical protein
MKKRGLETIWVIMIACAVILSIVALVVAYSNQPQYAPRGSTIRTDQGPSYNQTLKCTANYTCAVVVGSEPPSCLNNADCMNFSMSLPGPGIRTDSGYVVNETHLECVNNNTCAIAVGPGQNQCTNNSGCGNFSG